MCRGGCNECEAPGSILLVILPQATSQNVGKLVS